MATALRPMSLGELLDRTINLYRKNFVLFVGIAGVSQLAVLAARLFMLGTIFGARGGTRGVGAAAMMGALGLGSLIFFVIYLAAYAMSQAATVYAVSATYLEQPITIRQAYAKIKGSTGAVIGVVWLVGLVSIVGMVFLVVPGILLWLRYCLSVQAVVLENRGIMESMRRSKELTAGRRGDIFVTGFLWGVLFYIVMIVCQVPMMLVIAGSARGVQEMPALVQVLSYAGSFVGTTIMVPFLTIALSLLYYDQRVRKEAFDLQLMLATVEGGSLPAAGAAAGAP